MTKIRADIVLADKVTYLDYCSSLKRSSLLHNKTGNIWNNQTIYDKYRSNFLTRDM